LPDERRPSYVFPLLLIIVGLVLLLDQFGVWTVDWGQVLSLWPLLLILVGLDILVRSARLSGVLAAIVLVGALGVAAVILWPSLSVGTDTLSVEHNIDLDGVRQATVLLSSGVADIQVNGMESSRSLLSGEFSYPERRGAPTLETETADGHTRVAISSAEETTSFVGTRSSVEDWRVDLTTQVPIELVVNAGVGRTTLDLSDLTLDRLQVKAGVGEIKVTLATGGAYKASVDGGIGEITVIIPEGAAARVRVDQGLGNVWVDPALREVGRYYQTPEYGERADGIEVDIDGGIGAIRVEYR